MDNKPEMSVRRFHKKSVELRKELGKGHFGKVYKAYIRDSNLPKSVAIKIIWPNIKSGEENVDINELRKQAYTEMYKMSLLNHENIVKLLGMVESEIPWFVCEYMKDGNLLECLRKKPDLKDKDKIKFCYQISNGMEYLHQNKFLHKDLAARNILLDGKTIKIADMGLSSFTTASSGGIYSINGKPFAFRQAARECIVEQIYTFETDVWAFGVLMYEIWSHGSVPYGQKSTEADVRRIIVDGLNPLYARSLETPPIINSLMINNIFLVNWMLRPTFHELKLFFDGILKGKNIDGIIKPLQHHQQQQHYNTPMNQLQSKVAPLASPMIIEPEDRFIPADSGFRIRSNSNTTQRPPSSRPIQLIRKGFEQESSSSNPDLTLTYGQHGGGQPSLLSSSLPKYQPGMIRRGSHEPSLNHLISSHNNINCSNSSSPLSSSPKTAGSGNNSSWLFPSKNYDQARHSLTPQMSLDLPSSSHDGAKSSSTVSLYPEFIPGRFHKDRRINSHEVLN